MAAQIAAQKAVVERLHHGTRPQEIAQARANLDAAQADAVNARRQYARRKTLLASAASSQQDVDNAQAAMQVADAQVQVMQKALDLAIAGPRAEDIAQAEAQLRAIEAQMALLRRQLADARLVSPVDGIVQSRLLEPGDMASPQRPVFSIAITTPKWVRAYVPETDLAQVHPGMPAIITTDGLPGTQFRGWVGFISPVAEFTPKTVQTPELRTSLVFEVRVFVKDPSDDLRLGMPVTVTFPAADAAAAASATRSQGREAIPQTAPDRRP